MHKTKEQFCQEGPITVDCRYGGLLLLDKYKIFNTNGDCLFSCYSGVERTGVFISLSIVLEGTE